MGEAAKKRAIETPWLTTEEAAEYCLLSRDALIKHIARGRLIPDSWGCRGRTRSHRFLRETLDKFLKGR